MKSINSLILSLVFMMFISAAVFAESVAVIVNSSNTENFSKDDVKNVYSDRVVSWGDGKKIAVYNLPVDSDNREIFSQQVLGMSALDAVAAESNRAITNSLRNPQKMKRERLVTSIVSKKTNAIGYVSEKSVKNKSGIRILFVIN